MSDAPTPDGAAVDLLRSLRSLGARFDAAGGAPVVRTVADALAAAGARAASAERLRCLAAVCPHCRAGAPAERAAGGSWRHRYTSCYVPCRAGAIRGEGEAGEWREADRG